jgi:hypothetical protein
MESDQIARIREALKEAARYVTSDPEYCRSEVFRWIRSLSDHADTTMHAHASDLIRLGRNLAVGLAFLLADPDVMKSYLYGAIHELGCLRSELENRTRDGRTDAPTD